MSWGQENYKQKMDIGLGKVREKSGNFVKAIGWTPCESASG